MAFTDSITSANSSGTLSVPGVFPAPIVMEGYSTDASVALDAFKPSEPRMGVDGHLAGGFIPTPKVVKITLEANSPTRQAMSEWTITQEVAREVFVGDMVFTIPSIGRRFTYTRGFLTSTTPMPAGKKVLDPAEFEITFERVEEEPV